MPKKAPTRAFFGQHCAIKPPIPYDLCVGVPNSYLLTGAIIQEKALFSSLRSNLFEALICCVQQCCVVVQFLVVPSSLFLHKFSLLNKTAPAEGN